MREFPITERALISIKSMMLKQDEFGLAKYGKPLDFKDKYNWLEMLLEEMADGLKYIQCEIDKKKYIKELLEAGLRSDSPKEYIEVAINLLNVEGTGK